MNIGSSFLKQFCGNQYLVYPYKLVQRNFVLFYLLEFKCIFIGQDFRQVKEPSCEKMRLSTSVPEKNIYLPSIFCGFHLFLDKFWGNHMRQSERSWIWSMEHIQNSSSFIKKMKQFVANIEFFDLFVFHQQLLQIRTNI